MEEIEMVPWGRRWISKREAAFHNWRGEMILCGLGGLGFALALLTIVLFGK